MLIASPKREKSSYSLMRAILRPFLAGHYELDFGAYGVLLFLAILVVVSQPSRRVVKVLPSQKERNLSGALIHGTIVDPLMNFAIAIIAEKRFVTSFLRLEH